MKRKTFSQLGQAPAFGDIPAKYEFYTQDVSSLEGRILTLIDAGISNVEQRKAMKDLAREIIWNWVLPKSTAMNPRNTGLVV